MINRVDQSNKVDLEPQILNLRLREAEQQRVREAGLERQRLEDGRDRLRNLNSIQEEILQLNQLLEAGPAPDDITVYITRGNQLCSQVSEVVRTTAEVRSSPDLVPDIWAAFI